MSLCKIEGCNRPLNVKGLCSRHYFKLRKYGDPLAANQRDPQKGKHCLVAECMRPIVARGYCSVHYGRWKRTGDPLKKLSDRFESKHGPCKAAGCSEPRLHKGYCQTHYYRFWKHGAATGGRASPMRKRGEGTKNNGYHFTTVWINGTQRQIGTHRLVMEEHLGRKLEKNENIHHINGIRDDNRLENLELWVRTQPCGQRPQDLVAWAKEILHRYENEVSTGLFNI